MEGITLYDIDDFQITAVGDHQKDSLEQAEAIFAGNGRRIYEWYDGRDLIPRIQEIKEDAVTDLDLRIHKILGKLPLEDKEREELRKSIETAAGKVVNKMIFGLRDSLEKDMFLACVEGLEKLYEE
jgi:glutamyl-tRNA reductase